MCIDIPPDWWHKYVSVKLRKPQKSLPGVLTFSLALWIGLLPLFSALHLAMVPHVYSTEHRHLHEVVTVGAATPVEDTDRETASIFDQSATSSLTTLEECPFADLAIRQGMVTSRWSLPNLFDSPARDALPFSSTHISWPVLHRAPKHSPPFQTA